MLGDVSYLLFGRIASAVPWMKAWIFATSASVSLPVKSGMPRNTRLPAVVGVPPFHGDT